VKRLISLLLLVLVFFSVCIPSFAADGSIARAVIGADLTEEQIASVYTAFGFPRGSVTELRMTNELEHKYLDGVVDASVIGTRSVSCVYVEIRPAGSGLEVTTTDNITYFTPEMYIAALTTAGITDGKIIVAAPFEVSGTGALAGIYYAYEDLTGQTMDELRKSASTQELTVTGDLAEAVGDLDAADIVSDIKSALSAAGDLSDEQLKEIILAAAYQYNVSLTDQQISQLIKLCRSLVSLDEAGLLDRVTEMQDTIDRVTTAASGIASFFRTVKEIVTSVIDFFGKIKAAISG